MPQATLKPVSERAQLVLAHGVEDLLPGVDVEHGSRQPERAVAAASGDPLSPLSIHRPSLSIAPSLQPDHAVGERGDVALVGDDEHRDARLR